MRNDKPYRRLGILLCILTLTATLASTATAFELGLDAYGGQNFPNGSTGDGEGTVGGRLGAWFTLLDFMDAGFYVDSGAAFANRDDVDLLVVPTSFLFMARFPFLRSQAFPEGQLQPYVGVGPSVVWSEVDFDVDKKDSTNAGADVRGGVSWMIFRPFGVFAECCEIR